MNKQQIIDRCKKLGISQQDAEWINSNLYTYFLPDWSEMSWREIDTMFRDMVYIKNNPDLCAS